MKEPTSGKGAPSAASLTNELATTMESLSARLDSLATQISRLEKGLLDCLQDPAVWRKLDRFFAENLILSPLFSPKEANIILSHPKTGGNSLYYATERARENVGCTMHTHYLAPPATMFSANSIFSRLQGQFKEKNLQDLGKLYWHSEFNGQLGEFARHWVRKNVPLPLGEKLDPSHFTKIRRADLPRTNIIIGVREPISCCLSGYFQVMADTSAKELPNETVRADILYLLQRTFPLNQLHWWRNQVELFFGKDLLAEEFDRERGWNIYHFKGLSFLVIKQEAFSQAPAAMSALFDMPAELINIGNENAAADKAEVAQFYERAKAGLRFDTRTLDQVYQNRWFTHFYTQKEETVFREKWRL
jgi:hypothetical protein